MLSELQSRISRASGLLVDTNILLLAVIYDTDERLVEKFKRTASRFKLKDARLLAEVLTQARVLVSTPHVLTETSNLLGQLSDPLLTDARTTLYGMVKVIDERWTEAATIVHQDPLSATALRLGLSDAAIIHACSDGLLLLTDDALLAYSVSEAGGDAINFNHIRDLGD